jgi:prepilin-type N-terminal cleavage/methylation domain-containing protein
MVLKNKFNSLRKDRGFTIVELLIVIVVIAILAAIVIVAYGGITARANLQKTVTNATAARDVAEAFNAENGKYPSLTTDFATGSLSTHLPTGVTIVKGPAGALTSGVFTSGQWTTAGNPLNAGIAQTTVAFSALSAAPNTGGVITYWDTTTAALGVASQYVYVGSASATSTFITPAS